MRQKGPWLPGNTHKDKGEMWANLPAFWQGQCEAFIRSESVAIYCTLHRDGIGGKGKGKSKERVLLVTEHVVSYAKGNQ